MSSPTPASSFDAFLSELARAPAAPVQASHLPAVLRSATIVAERYRIERLLGHGGMGEVYLATDRKLRRKVALKLAQSRLVADATRRWLREAEALARIEHDNVVEVFEVGTHDGRPYIAMQWIDGETLAHWVPRAAPSWQAIVACYAQAGHGLRAAHEHGLVHRDFKPSNVLRGRDGRVKVIDFGLATRGRPPDSKLPTKSSLDRSVSGDDRSNTHAGAGTLGYAAPEQLMGRDADPRSDQFALCASVFVALYGRLPYPGDDVGEVLGGMARELTMPPRTPSVPAFVERAVQRGLAVAPETRFESMAELLDALDPVANQTRRRRALRNAVILGAVPVTIAVFAVSGEDRCDALEAEFERTWSPAVAAAVDERFEQTGSPMAAVAAAGAINRLDTFAAQWLEQRRRVCLARDDLQTAPGPARACLDAARIRADGAVRALLEVDRAHVPNTGPILDALLPPTACVGPPRSAQRPALEPQMRRATAPIREHLDASKARRLVGRTASALTDANKALALATDLGDEALIAEAQLARGLATVADGSTDRGLDDLQAAYWTATAAKHDHVATQAARAVLSHIVLGPRQWAQAERWYELALSAERRLGTVVTPSWRLLRAQGDAARGADRFDEAHASYAEALRRQEQARAQPQERIGMLNAMSALSYGQIRYEDALAWAERARTLARDELPRLHPRHADALRSKATALAMLRPREALAPAQQAVEIREVLYGADAPMLVDALNALGDAQTRAGQLQAAVVSLTRSVAIAEAHPDRHQIEVGHANLYLAAVLVDLGQLPQARAAFEAAARGFERVGGDEAYNLGLAYASLGEVEVRAENLPEAERAMDRAIELVRTVQPLQLAGLLANRGQIRLGRQDVDGALADFDEAAALIATTGSDEQEVASLVESGRAYGHLAQGHPELAIAAAKRSVRLKQERTPTPTHSLVDAHVVAASVLHQAGAPDEAVATARRGLGQLNAIDDSPRLRRTLLRMIAEASCTLGDSTSSREAIATAQTLGPAATDTTDPDTWVPLRCR